MNPSKSPHHSEPNRARFRLASTSGAWLDALAAIVAADEQSQPRPVTPGPDQHRYVDSYGIYLDDWFTPAAWTNTGLRDAVNLLDAAWDAGILTGPYRPSLLSQATYEHRVILDPGPGFPQLVGPPGSPDDLRGSGQHGAPAAAQFLRHVVEQANRLLDQLEAYLRLRMAPAERAEQDATRFLAERQAQPDPGAEDTAINADRPMAGEPRANRDSVALHHLDRLIRAIHHSRTRLPIPAHQNSRPATGSTGATESLRFDKSSRAFYSGVGAGATAGQQLAAVASQNPKADEAMRQAYFWLHVGLQLQASRPGASEAEQSAFLRGASLRAPQETEPVFLLRIEHAPDPRPDDLDHCDDEDGADGDALLPRIAGLVWRVGERVREGLSTGDVRDDAGALIATYRVRSLL